MSGSLKPWLKIDSTVRAAQESGRPVVALESTVISHGLPYPENLATAQELEAIIQANGAVPATIAILDGIVRVGLDGEALQRLARSRDVAKVSRRDLPAIVAQKRDGATTVAATMVVAHLAGIPVFATGGIGGVHRHAPFDVSADLPELAQTPVIVVCAGAKAILDLPLTMEWLETHGVPVVGYGTDTLPAFYTRSSGLPVDVRVETPDQVTELYLLERAMGLQGGMLVTVPVPAGEALDSDVVEEAIEMALEQAQARGIRGREVTPYLLSRLVELTGGQSLRSNVALLRNNAAVAAQIACSLAGRSGL